MSFSPVVASKNITEKYYRYLKTSFRMGEPYKKEFEALIDNGNSFASGPYLDVTDAFTKGKSINELINEGVLPKAFKRIKINLERPLYKHQENAIRKIAIEHKNLVVSTGTGSGKTESFLIPVLRELVNEYANGTLGPGVRALLIYPMNALANDQTERLRGLLADFPEITFGVYTGQTKYTYEEALSEYKSLNGNEDPIPNEMISRDQMITTPPNILITNYAMLEYLMIRPRDNVFFDGPFAQNWKFIVFDEAHVYNGSTGIEVSMLFRRLKAKIGDQKITYVLTSATLGEKEDDEKVAEFAQNLCNAPFDKDDIVRADRITPQVDHSLDTLLLSFYSTIARSLDENCSDKEILSRIGEDRSQNLGEFLYNKILHDYNYWRMRALLEKPQTVYYLAKNMGWSDQQLTDFVAVASLAEKNAGKLFDARYHMFLRATESAFVTLAPDNRVMLNRANYRYNEEKVPFKVFEVASCSHCDAIYLVGKNKNNILEHHNVSDEIETKEIYLLATSVSDTDEDHLLEDEGFQVNAYEICPHCGYLRKSGSHSHCEHKENAYVKVFKVATTGEKKALTKCLKCEHVNTSGILRMFFSGQEASTSVIGTALYEELPSYEIVVKEKTEADDFGDDFGFDSEPKKLKTAKQFIAFSDSRQAAAFYASYLSLSYNNILYKRLIMETLSKIEAGKDYSIPTFVDKLKNEFSNYDVYGKSSFSDDHEYASEKEAWKAILSELIDNNGSTSLSHFGLLGIDIDINANYKKFDLSESEFKDLCSVFAKSMLTDAAITYDAPLNNNDIDDFTHGVEYTFTLSDSDEKKLKKAFIPTKSGLSNKRIDYLQRVLTQKGIELSNDEASSFLKLVWDKVFIGKSLIKLVEGNAYRIDANKIRICKPKHWYVCNKCGRLTHHNIQGVCPAYQCRGILKLIDPSKIYSDNHYYRLYNEMEIRDLKIVEHTAQLNRDMAFDYQNKFKNKEIDILSCSTTFEMGVDVGSLETVFMRNMPPMPSNYAQRAGRAGRSSKSAAFALTFCNKSSHDFSYFNNPVRMIKGRIDPPKYEVENDRIAIRHLYASALGFFWKSYPQYFKTVGKFLEADAGGLSGLDHFRNYLSAKPEDLKVYLLKFMPSTLSNKFGISTYEWLDCLIGEEGSLTEAVKSYNYEVSLLEQAKQDRFSRNQSVDAIMQRIKAFSSEDILSFMSRKNILPKYGFPVDTVEMTVMDNKHRAGLGLQLSRDLSMAISEYAPGSQVVANNNLITSRYIKKIPNIGWKMYSYIKCEQCQTLNIKTFTTDEDNVSSITECCQCLQPFTQSPKVFLIPAQGFAADGEKIRKPGLKKPERTYRSDIAYVGFNTDFIENRYEIGNAILNVKTSQNDEMAAINDNPFYVCSRCGYADMDPNQFVNFKSMKHKTENGFVCSNKKLQKYSLGYRFLTDVVRITFENYEINEYNQALSILYGFLNGIRTYLNIEEGDISGCLQSNFNNGRISYSMVIFDNTPGGAGHTKRINDACVLEGIMRYTLSQMKSCMCGNVEGDSSCYSCLRSYRNQKHHDLLKRKYVIDFLEQILL